MERHHLTLKVTSFANIMTSRENLSIQMTLILKYSPIKILDLWVIFPKQLESSNMNVCRRNYDQNTKTAQIRMFYIFSLVPSRDMVPTRDRSSLSRLVPMVTTRDSPQLSKNDSFCSPTCSNQLQVFSKHELSQKHVFNLYHKP